MRGGGHHRERKSFQREGRGFRERGRGLGGASGLGEVGWGLVEERGCSMSVY